MVSRRKAEDVVCPPVSSPPKSKTNRSAMPARMWAGTSQGLEVDPWRAWLELDAEVGRLSGRWSEVETWLAREWGWFALTPAERHSLPQAAEMFEIDRRIEELCEERDRLLERLSATPASDMGAVAGKLAVAIRLLEDEEGLAHRLVVDAAKGLASTTP